MKWKSKPLSNEYWYENWTPWFAWWPVRLLSGQTAWLETVYRKDGEPLNDCIVWIYTDDPTPRSTR